VLPIVFYRYPTPADAARRTASKVWIRRTVLTVASTAVVITPVLIRNFVVGRDIVPIASQGGVNFFIGNNSESDGRTAIVPGTRWDWWGGYQDAIQIAEREAGRKLKPSEVSSYYFWKGFEFIVTSPGESIPLLARKLYLFWAAGERSNNKYIYFFWHKSGMGRVPLPGFWLVGPLGLLGGVLLWRRKRELSLLYLFVLSYMVGVVAFFVNARFRLPVVPILTIFAAYAVCHLWIAATRERAGLWKAIIILAVCFVVIDTDLVRFGENEIHKDALSHYTLGNAYLNRGESEKAIAEYEKALETHDKYRRPGFLLVARNVHYNLGRLYWSKKQCAKAIPHLEKVGGNDNFAVLSLEMLGEGRSRPPQGPNRTRQGARGSGGRLCQTGRPGNGAGVPGTRRGHRPRRPVHRLENRRAAKGSVMPPPMTIALIEIGTNSTKLLIAEPDPVHEFRIRYFARRTTRIGRGLANDRNITPMAIDENVAAIETLKKTITRHRCRHVFAVSTFALRKARNARTVARRLEETIGDRIKILTGKEEARFAYLSARRNLKLARSVTVLIDVGGGSTEFVVTERGCVIHSRSLPLGALSLTERYLHVDPIKPDEFGALTRRVNHVVRHAVHAAGVDQWSPRDIDLAASGGTIGAISHVIGGGGRRGPSGSSDITVIAPIPLGETAAFLDRCLALPLRERRRIPGLDPDRADIICAGLAIVLSLMRTLGKRVCRPNTGGVREGALLHLIQNEFRW
jgi:tetratricopeptide (TPR) repeat protein